MRTIALDVGTKTIGVAVSDELGIAANGITTIQRKSIEQDLGELNILLEEYKPREILVGVPYNMEGGVSKRGDQILRFADKIRAEFSLPVVFWDESFSTVNAEEKLIQSGLSRKKRKKVIDKMAAVFILQEYLESKRV
ncbi:MAG: Holliday junction resolvase RuvX [Deltaproteobacteria bacterium]|nr:Holliday junction resolvase RuvX [Deltaproteobacteria bacterium]MCK5709848.1 Holliday junction resolvase RuvX [Deltaproteobacteria bacterium]